jgi:hypothetical protein
VAVVSTGGAFDDHADPDVYAGNWAVVLGRPPRGVSGLTGMVGVDAPERVGPRKCARPGVLHSDFRQGSR